MDEGREVRSPTSRPQPDPSPGARIDSASEDVNHGSDSALSTGLAADSEGDDEFGQALAEYVTAAAQHASGDGDSEAVEAARGGEDSDSSEDDRPNRNTVGEVPLEWYAGEDHVGYDLEGQKLLRAARGDRLDALLARNDRRAALRCVYDAANDEMVALTREELALIMRIRKGHFPHVAVDPHAPYIDYFSGELAEGPIRNDPPPKRRFTPSKWEEQKIVKLVRAMRKGWLRTGSARRRPAPPPVYLLWGDGDDAAGTTKTPAGLAYIPAAKPRLPGHEESYNPPREYLPSEEELAANELADAADRPAFVPRVFDSLRQVPAYAAFINERFERCLDLYLCPRVRKRRLFIDPDSLVPRLPKPSELQPFPTLLAHRFLGHTGRVRCLASHPGGQWLASGSDDGTLRLWEVSTGRCVASWQLGAAVVAVGWCPDLRLQLLSAAVGSAVVLLPSGVGGAAAAAAAAAALDAALAGGGGGGGGKLAAWRRREGLEGAVEVAAAHALRGLAWHARGDYFATVAPGGSTQAVLVHQLSRGATQNPFRRTRGRVAAVAFHPSQPLFFVATQDHVRIYNLAKQALAKQLVGGGGAITCMGVHPGGDHVIVGSDDRRLAWYDLDLSTTPYKALRYHSAAVRGAEFHPSGAPLFASASDDGAVHVFHGRVYADLLTNPLIVPVKILRGHQVVDHSGVMACAWHSRQPWLFTAGADATICLFCN